MDKDKVRKLVEEYAKLVIANMVVNKIILYGSYARGDFNKHSDVDVMILTDVPEEEIFEYKDKIWDYAYDIEWDNNFDIQLSILVKNIEKYNQRIDVIPFYYNVHTEGVVIFDAV